MMAFGTLTEMNYGSLKHSAYLRRLASYGVRLVAAALFLAVVQAPQTVKAEDLPWNDQPAERGYLPDQDGPRDISPDKPAYDAPPAQRYDAPPAKRYDAPPRNNYSGRDDRSYDNRPITEQQYSSNEISQAGHQFFGSVSVGLAKVVEHAFKSKGRPNGYILGEEAGGAIIAGLRYGEGTLFTKSAGQHKVYWQGPSIGYDFGAAGSKTMILVYNLYSPKDVFRTYGGVAGSAYFVGGVGITYLQRDHVSLAPIVSGVGLRVGANVGYLKFTRRPTWNPF
jgi:hypothetical protein